MKNVACGIFGFLLVMAVGHCSASGVAAPEVRHPIPGRDGEWAVVLSELGGSVEECFGRLGEFPDKDKLEVVALDLSNNGLFDLPIDELRGFPNIRVLDLSNNPGLSLSDDALVVFPQLEAVDLSNTSLTDRSFASAGLAGLRHLRILNCNHNGLTALPAISSLPAGLRVLDLSDNRIAGLALSEGLSEHKKLKALSLRHNAITEISEKWVPLKGVLYLDLDSNDIRTVASSGKDTLVARMERTSGSYVSFQDSASAALTELFKAGAFVQELGENGVLINAYRRTVELTSVGVVQSAVVKDSVIALGEYKRTQHAAEGALFADWALHGISHEQLLLCDMSVQGISALAWRNKYKIGTGVVVGAVVGGSVVGGLIAKQAAKGVVYSSAQRIGIFAASGFLGGCVGGAASSGVCAVGGAIRQVSRAAEKITDAIDPDNWFPSERVSVAKDGRIYASPACQSEYHGFAMTAAVVTALRLYSASLRFFATLILDDGAYEAFSCDKERFVVDFVKYLGLPAEECLALERLLLIGSEPEFMHALERFLPRNITELLGGLMYKGAFEDVPSIAAAGVAQRAMPGESLEEARLRIEFDTFRKNNITEDIVFSLFTRDEMNCLVKYLNLLDKAVRKFRCTLTNMYLGSFSRVDRSLVEASLSSIADTFSAVSALLQEKYSDIDRIGELKRVVSKLKRNMDFFESWGSHRGAGARSE